MRECFICGTCFPCEHRETELLPTEKLRAGRIAATVEREMYDATALDTELHSTQEILKERSDISKVLNELRSRKRPVKKRPRKGC